MSAAMKSKRKGRVNIVSEKMDIDPNYVPETFKKSPEAERKIREGLQDNPLFSGLEDSMVGQVVAAMAPKVVQMGQQIITQGKHRFREYGIIFVALSNLNENKARQSESNKNHDGRHNHLYHQTVCWAVCMGAFYARRRWGFFLHGGYRWL
jgi:hypothetical protein